MLDKIKIQYYKLKVWFLKLSFKSKVIVIALSIGFKILFSVLFAFFCYHYLYR